MGIEALEERPLAGELATEVEGVQLAFGGHHQQGRQGIEASRKSKDRSGSPLALGASPLLQVNRGPRELLDRLATVSRRRDPFKGDVLELPAAQHPEGECYKIIGRLMSNSKIEPEFV
ncbi:hypothetical protein GCM10028820_07420 [Tessaracoccus terricola]